VANRYRYDPSKRWTDRMVENARDIVDGGETMWEDFLAGPDAPWASRVPAAKRPELNALITRVYEEVARLRRARANARAAIDARRRDAR
jgi:hypothetical protein